MMCHIPSQSVCSLADPNPKALTENMTPCSLRKEDNHLQFLSAFTSVSFMSSCLAFLSSYLNIFIQGEPPPSCLPPPVVLFCVHLYWRTPFWKKSTSDLLGELISLFWGGEGEVGLTYPLIMSGWVFGDLQHNVIFPLQPTQDGRHQTAPLFPNVTKECNIYHRLLAEKKKEGSKDIPFSWASFEGLPAPHRPLLPLLSGRTSCFTLDKARERW